MGPRKIARSTWLFFASILVAWILAWVVKTHQRIPAWESTMGSFLYWTFAKIGLWLLPSLWWIRRTGRTLREVLRVDEPFRWIGWGAGLGLAVASLNIAWNLHAGHPWFPRQIDTTLLNVVVVAPLLEEFLLRGAILGALRQENSFPWANVSAALMFVGLHLPGWYFMGTFEANLVRFEGAASVFLIGLVAGYATKNGRSVLSGILVHFLNNLT